MLNTGNLLGSVVAPTSASGLLNKNPAQATQTTSPAAIPFQGTTAQGLPSGQTITPGLSGLIPLTPPNPNADAIQTLHNSSLEALNTPPPQTNASDSLAGTGLPGGTNSMGTQILTPAQLTAQNGGVANLPQTSSQNNNGSTGANTGTGAASTPSFPGLVGTAAGYAAGNIPIGQTAQQIGQNYGQQIANIGNLGAGMVAGDMSTGTNAIGEGNAAIASNAASSRISALGTAESAALAGTGQQLTAQNQAESGTQGAAGLIQPSGTYPFVFNPATGTYTQSTGAGGTTGGTTGSTIQTPAQVAAALNSGTMSPDQATAALSYLGGTAQSQLVSAMQQVNPNFNWNQATTNSAIQGSLDPAVANANAQLANLQSVIQSSPSLVSTGIPLLNSFTKLISSTSGVGAGSTQALQSALTDARAAMANALGVANNSTPSTYDSYVNSLLPDGITPAQVGAAIQQFQAQIAGKQAAYGSPGTATVTTSQNGTNTNSTSDSSLYNF